MELGKLPVGWALEKLGSLATKVTKGATPTTYGYEFQRSGVNFLKIQNVSHGEIDTTSIVDFISEDAHQFQKKSILQVDDVIFSIAGTIGETAILKECHLPANTNQAFAIISGFSDFLVPKYLEFQLRSFVAQKTKEKARGGAMNNVSLDDLKNLEVLLPPPAEQHRIVAKIEELFSELDQGVASLKTAREQLKVYRQSLLKNAFEGKLTAAWRAAHANQLETAAALQQRIARERTDRHRQQLADWQANGQQGPKPKPPKLLPPLTPEELAELPELPAGWGWMRLDMLSEKITDGEHITPRRSATGFYLLSARNIQNGFVDLSNVDYVPEDEYQRIRKRCNPEADDILISCSGSIGRISRVPENLDCVMVRSVALVKLLKPGIAPIFLEYQLQGPFLQKQIDKGKKATAQANLFLGPINNLRVAVCSLSEQQAIVQELESKLSEADQLDQTLATALQQADALRQSILKKAFCGQLVEQDPNDEPASALLERIRAGRCTKTPARRGRSARSQS